MICKACGRDFWYPAPEDTCDDCFAEQIEEHDHPPCPSCADLREKLTHLLERIANGEGCNCASDCCVDREWITKEIERCAKDR